MKTTTIFFLSNLYLKVYVMVDFICIGLLELRGVRTENYKMKNSCPQRDSNSRYLDITMPLPLPTDYDIWYTIDKLKLN